MSVDFEEFRKRLKSLGLPVYRNKAPTGTAFPYYVYTYTSTENVRASGLLVYGVLEYQVSLFTTGIETELQPFRKTFSDVPFTDFRNSPIDENGETTNNFYTYVRVVE